MIMAAADYKALVQSIYISYFGRPADTLGLANFAAQLDTLKAPTTVNGLTAAYATTPALKSLIDSFGTSTESVALYGTDTTAFVAAIYANMLNRVADYDGLLWWVNEINAGRLTKGNASLAIMAGAVNNTSVQGLIDAKVLENKIAIAANFTAAVDTAPELVAYSGNAAAAIVRDMLKTVSDKTVVATFQATVDATLKTLVDGGTGSTPGQAFTLTTGSDTVTGGAGNDVFNVSTGLSADGINAIATSNALDKIDGGAGLDTLNIENTGGKNTLSGTITNVENLTFIGAGNVNNNASADVSAFSGVVKLQQTDDIAVAVAGVKGQTLSLDRVAATTTLTATLDAAQTSVTLSNAAAVGTATFSVSGAKLDTVNLTTDKTAGALTVADTGNTTKTANITATGTAAVTVNSTALETVKISGAGAVTLTAGTAPSKALDASGSTGGVTYAVDLVAQQFTGSSAKDTVQFGATTKAQTLGAGDDAVTMSVAALATGGSIDGGDGTDTITLAAANAATATSTATLGAAFQASISNFEKLGLQDTAAAVIVDAKYIDGITYITSAGTTGGALTLNNVAGNSTVELTGASAVHANAVTVNLVDNTGTSDVINLVLKAAADDTFGTVSATGIETLKITSTDSNATVAGTTNHSLTITDTAAQSIVVTGNAHLTLTQASTALTSVDASGMTVTSAATGADTAGLSFATGVLTKAATLTGSDGVDVINASAVTDATVKLTINGGLGGKAGSLGDTLTGGAGDDTITANGLGNHVLAGGGGKDIITGGSGNDTITGGAGADTLKGNGGNDIFAFVAVSDSAPSAFDTITDFVAKTATVNGDVLSFTKLGIGAATSTLNHVFVANSGSLALAALSSTDFGINKVNFALDSSTGTLYIDSTSGTAGTSDGIADIAIILTGVTTIDANAITLV
jgi:Ca2+-binding RTX toxin-like protein